MQRLLNSLSQGIYGNDKITLIISIDNSGTDEVKKCADIFFWKFGEKKIVVQPVNELDSAKIEDYSITFDESANNIDVFLQNINVKHFNTAEWVLLNFAGGNREKL